MGIFIFLIRWITQDAWGDCLFCGLFEFFLFMFFFSTTKLPPLRNCFKSCKKLFFNKAINYLPMVLLLTFKILRIMLRFKKFLSSSWLISCVFFYFLMYLLTLAILELFFISLASSTKQKKHINFHKTSLFLNLSSLFFLK